MRCSQHKRRGYNLMEVSAAMLILALVLPMVAQLACWSLRQRSRTLSQHAALELANNVLESARACSWPQLSAEWAAAQKIPADITPLLPDGTLTAQVEPDKQQARRVTVTVTWSTGDPGPPRQLRLVTLLSPRMTTGGQP